MPPRTNRAIIVGVSAAAIAILLFAAVGAVTDAGVASAAHETGDHPDWIHHENHTVKFSTHEPGQSAALSVWASIPENDVYGAGLEEYRVAANYIPASFLGGAESGEEVPCSREDLKTGGVDRGANLSGTGIDESVVSNIKNYWMERTDGGEMYIMVETYTKDDFGGEHLSLNYTDQVVIQTSDCFTTPQQPGWYRIGSYSNGTTWDGDYMEGAGYSHYFHICECEDREEAIEKLGPPPVEGYGHEGSRVYKTTAELDDGPPDTWELAAPRDPGEHQGGATTPAGTSTQTSAGTAVPATTETPGPGPGGSAATQTQAAGGATSTSASNEPADGGSGASDDADSAPGGTAPGGNEQSTPTASEGPGLGPLVALVGLLASTLLLYRRR